MSIKDLQTGGLYVVLFIRADSPVKDDFHWALYLHQISNNGGSKYHIKNQGSGWITDHGMTSGIFKEFLLVGLFHIATVRDGLRSHVNLILRTYDTSLNTPGISCRVWLLWVLALLQQPINGCLILKCTDLDILEAEIKAWGNDHAISAAENKQPRPIGVSMECEL